MIAADSVSVADRVALGVQLLDEKEPRWWRRVDLDRLDMFDPYGCVAGQLKGGFEKALIDWFGGDINSAAAHGMTYLPLSLDDLPYAVQRDHRNAEYVALEAVWRRVIKERRGEQVDVVVLG